MTNTTTCKTSVFIRNFSFVVIALSTIAVATISVAGLAPVEAATMEKTNVIS